MSSPIPPSSPPELEVVERTSDMGPQKRTANEGPLDEPPAKRNKAWEDEIKKGVKEIIRKYGLDDAQTTHLEMLADLVGWVPTIDEVEWVADQAKLHDSEHRLDIWLFAYMEYYPWFLRSKEGEHRLWLGAFRRYDGLTWHAWIGFHHHESIGLRGQLYTCGPKGRGKPKGALRIKPWVRRWLAWHKPLTHLFQLDEMTPEDPDDESKNKAATILQNDYLAAVMKVLARFPGLIMEYNYDTKQPYQLYEGFNPWPFKDKEQASPQNTLADLSDLLGKQKKDKPSSRTTSNGVSAQFEQFAEDDTYLPEMETQIFTNFALSPGPEDLVGTS
jgi:hypothetical protein